MSYREALEAAGAEVLEFAEFGSYQGDWWAKVKVNDEVGFIHGYYGSCSGCDAFEAEFGFDDPTPEKLVAFGKEYLDEVLSFDQAIARASSDLEWDLDAKEAMDFIKKCAE